MSINPNTIKITAPERRYRIFDYLRPTPTSKYVQLGSGVNSLDESYGVQEQTKTYTKDKEATSITLGYQRGFSYNLDLIVSEEALEALREVGERGLTGTDAMFEYVRVNLFQPKATTEGNSSFYARHWIVSALPDGENGTGGEIVSHTGNLKPVGGMDEGYFDITTGEFTKDDKAYSATMTIIKAASTAPAT